MGQAPRHTQPRTGGRQPDRRTHISAPGTVSEGPRLPTRGMVLMGSQGRAAPGAARASGSGQGREGVPSEGATGTEGRAWGRGELSSPMGRHPGPRAHGLPWGRGTDAWRAEFCLSRPAHRDRGLAPRPRLPCGAPSPVREDSPRLRSSLHPEGSVPGRQEEPCKGSSEPRPLLVNLCPHFQYGQAEARAG